MPEVNPFMGKHLFPSRLVRCVPCVVCMSTIVNYWHIERLHLCGLGYPGQSSP